MERAADAAMTDTAIQELLASCEAALDAADRSLRIARALADGCRARLHPPDDVLEAYLVCVERDEAHLKELADRVEQIKGRASVSP
jgi:hypothetical protein